MFPGESTATPPGRSAEWRSRDNLGGSGVTGAAGGINCDAVSDSRDRAVVGDVMLPLESIVNPVGEEVWCITYDSATGATSPLLPAAYLVTLSWPPPLARVGYVDVAGRIESDRRRPVDIRFLAFDSNDRVGAAVGAGGINRD